MRILLAPTVLLLSACGALAEDPKVSLEATVSPPAKRGLISTFSVRLVGAGKDVSVLTDGLSATVTQADKKATVTVTLAERKDDKGRLIVPSATLLKIVKLQPGEVAGIHVPSTPDVYKVITAAAAGEVELVVEYEVSESWGKRFGVASGKVKGTATVAK